jgi:hypothetical protein
MRRELVDRKCIAGDYCRVEPQLRVLIGTRGHNGLASSGGVLCVNWGETMGHK